MTNLDIIKYLANNNPARLAELLDDIYCNAWNCGSYAGSNGEGKILEECEMEFSESEWLEQEANTNFFFDHELEAWSEDIEYRSKVLCKTEISEILIEGKPYYPYTVYQPMGGGSIGSFGRKDTYNEAIDIVCKTLQDLKIEATYINDDGNLTVTFPVKDPDHMWNNNNDYDYKEN